MAKTPIRMETIHETLRDQFEKTMHVVNRIKGDTSKLVETTNSIIGKLEHGEMDETLEIAEPETEPVDDVFAEQTQEQPLNAVERELVQRIGPTVVREVIQEIQPLLERLRQIAGEAGAPAGRLGVDDPTADSDAFVKNMIQHMERTMDDRMRTALIRRNKMSKP